MTHYDQFFRFVHGHFFPKFFLKWPKTGLWSYFLGQKAPFGATFGKRANCLTVNPCLILFVLYRQFYTLFGDKNTSPNQQISIKTVRYSNFSRFIRFCFLAKNTLFLVIIWLWAARSFFWF